MVPLVAAHAFVARIRRDPAQPLDLFAVLPDDERIQLEQPVEVTDLREH